MRFDIDDGIGKAVVFPFQMDSIDAADNALPQSKDDKFVHEALQEKL